MTTTEPKVYPWDRSPQSTTTPPAGADPGLMLCPLYTPSAAAEPLCLPRRELRTLTKNTP